MAAWLWQETYAGALSSFANPAPGHVCKRNYPDVDYLLSSLLSPIIVQTVRERHWDRAL